MRHRGLLRTLLVSALVTLISASCALATPAPAPTPVPAADTPVPPTPTPSPIVNSLGVQLPADAAPLEKQVVRLLGREEKHFDVSAGWYEGSVIAGSVLLWEPLTTLDENNNPIPASADSWEVSADGKVWTFHLRDGALWSDGKTPVTAQDFEYAFRRALHPSTGNSWAWFYYDIKGAADYNTGKVDADGLGIKAVDDLTLTIETETSVPYLPLLMAFPSSVPVPRHMVEQYGDQWSLSPDTALANATFRLISWSRGQQVEIGLNPYYNGPNKGYLEKVVVELGDPDGEIDATHDIVPALSSAALDVITNSPELSKELHAWPYPATFYMFFRTQAEPFDNMKVRQAISHAIDRDAIIATAMKGLAIPAYTMLPPGFPCYQGDKVADMQKFDPELARSLLAEAGYPGGEGFPAVDMWMPTPTEAHRAAMEAVQSMLKENLGIEVGLQPVERQVYNDSWMSGKVPMAMIGWSYDYLDPSDFMELVWGSKTPRHDWANPEFDRITSEAKGLQDVAKRCEMYNEAERLLLEEAPGVFLWHPVSNQLWKPYVKGIPTDNSGYQRLLLFYNTFTTMYVGK
jgi:oligopeptide transport system substrate-binding protein